MYNLQHVFGGAFVTYATLAMGALVCGLAAVTDIATRRIPNWLTFATIGMAVVVAGSRGPLEFFYAIIFVLAALTGGVVLQGMGLLGGGDVKLLVGVSALVGLPNLVAFLLYTSLAGGALALIFSICTGRLVEISRHAALSLRLMLMTKSVGSGPNCSGATGGVRLPYAVAIAAGFVLLVLSKTYLPVLRIPL